jgi:DNA-binding CsgD family transcriptional regulator
MAFPFRISESAANYCERSTRWPHRLLRWLQTRERAMDAVPAVVLVACSAGAIMVSGRGWGSGHSAEIAWIAASGLPLAWRSRWPLPTLIATLAIYLACMAITPRFVLAPAASLVALCTLASRMSATRAGRYATWAAGCASAVAITVPYALTHPQPESLGATLVTFDFVIAAVGTGAAARARRARIAEAETRAEQAERSRAEAEQFRTEELARRRAAAASISRLAALTPREREVVSLIATGLSNEEIAKRLFLARVTVKTHANRAMAKLGARDRAQLVMIAYETGLVRASALP